MPLGVIVRNRTAPPSRGIPTDTGVLFTALKVGQVAPDNLEMAKLRSMGDFEAAFGKRDVGANAAPYDYIDNYFREGGTIAYVGRYELDPDEAFTLFPKELGPGQVSAPQEAPGAATYTALLQHASANNRFALLDVEIGEDPAAMVLHGGEIPASGEEHGALFGPWVETPPPVGVVGATGRTVPASSSAAALCARADALGNPNRAPAGRDFPLQNATGFDYDLIGNERELLLDAGVNPLCEVYGVLQLYGFQTGMEQTRENPFWQANCGRTRMWLTAQCAAVGENYMFKPIDGRGRLQEALKTELVGVCLDLYNVDGLFGEIPEEAFAVDVSSSINTIETIAQGELHAIAEVRLSLHAKTIYIDLVSVPITGVV